MLMNRDDSHGDLSSVQTSLKTLSSKPLTFSKFELYHGRKKGEELAKRVRVINNKKTLGSLSFIFDKTPVDFPLSTAPFHFSGMTKKQC